MDNSHSNYLVGRSHILILISGWNGNGPIPFKSNPASLRGSNLISLFRSNSLKKNPNDDKKKTRRRGGGVGDKGGDHGEGG